MADACTLCAGHTGTLMRFEILPCSYTHNIFTVWVTKDTTTDDDVMIQLLFSNLGIVSHIISNFCKKFFS